MTSRADRALALVPIAFVAVGVLSLYFVEAWMRKTPWVFTDEAEWTQISRAIASTGHPARRGEPINFKSLYAFLIAPVWWIHSTALAYAVIKYLNAVVMSLAAVPTYLLARMYVSRRTAAIVAVFSVLIPAMAYAATIIPEVLAYPWYATCSWLIVRALVLRSRLPVALAIGASIVAVGVRSPQFVTVGASFAIAAAGLWLTGPRGKAWRRDWTRGDTLGAIVLLVGGLIVFNRVVLQHVHEWQLSTEYWKDRMLDLGLKAGLAFTVGLGILPVIGGVASLRLPERRGDPRYRAFTAYLASSIFCIGLYTAVKAAYLSTIFATLTEERNLIYLSPVMLLGTAMVLEARRVDWRLVTGAAAFVLFLILVKPLALLYPYFEAPGTAIFAILKQHAKWTTGEIRLVLLAMFALSLVVLVFRHVRWVIPVAAIAVGGWMIAAEIGTTRGTLEFADKFRSNLPQHLDWVDRKTHGQPVTYVGQEILDPNGVLLTEFWNRDIKHVYSLDGSAPPPGPTYMPEVSNANGLLSGIDTPYVLADNGVTLQGKPVEHEGSLVLYRKKGPWRLLDEEQQVYSDGWAPEWSTYTYFRPGQRGKLVVQVGRQGYTGDAAPGRALVSVGTVAFRDGTPVLGTIAAQKRTLVENGASQTFEFPIERTPVRVVISIPNTFKAGGDPRNLGAQVGFRFVPTGR